MKKPYDKPMTAAEIAATTDRDIDFSDVPPLDDAFWQNATLVEPDRTQAANPLTTLPPCMKSAPMSRNVPWLHLTPGTSPSPQAC
jgi:hypothetical protein